MFLEICMQIHSVVFATNRQINKQKLYAKTIYLLCAGKKYFVKYQAQGGGVNPKLPPCVSPCPLVTDVKENAKRGLIDKM